MNGRSLEWYDSLEPFEGEGLTIEPPEDISHEDYEEMLVDAELEKQFLDKESEANVDR